MFSLESTGSQDLASSKWEPNNVDYGLLINVNLKNGKCIQKLPLLKWEKQTKQNKPPLMEGFKEFGVGKGKQ